MLMKYNGATVAIVGGTVRVTDASGQQQIVPWDQLEVIENLHDRGETEGAQYIKLVLEKTGIGVESNGVWPEDIPKLLRQCLKAIDEGRDTHG